MKFFDFQAQWEDAKNFAQGEGKGRGGGTLHCLDATATPESLEPTVRRQVVSDTEIEEWVQNPPWARDSDPHLPMMAEAAPSAKRLSLRIVAVEDPKRTERLEWIERPLLVKKNVYRTIVDHLDISSLFLNAAINRAAVHFKHHQRPEETDPRFQYVFRTYPTPKRQFCLGLTYRPSNMKTTAFLSGLHNEEIQELFKLIESEKMLLASPMLIPVILAGFTLTNLRHRLFKCHAITDNVKDKMGLASSVLKPTFHEPLVTDSLELSQTLTFIFSKLAKYDQHCRSLLDLLHVIDEASGFCLEVTPQSHKAMVGEATAFVRTSISYLTSTTESSKSWTELLNRRAQGYVQTVYSLTAQRGSSLNIELAKSSLRIAKATHSDNVVMRAIAEDSKTVAIESLHKNHTMRSIAVITILFLPATFIATLFSTSFFNFQSKDGMVVSRWIWLYVLVTAVMTAVIQGVWFLNTRNDIRIGRAVGDLN